jgi:hypothetical protein
MMMARSAYSGGSTLLVSYYLYLVDNTRSPFFLPTMC